MQIFTCLPSTYFIDTQHTHHKYDKFNFQNNVAILESLTEIFFEVLTICYSEYSSKFALDCLLGHFIITTLLFFSLLQRFQQDLMTNFE